MQKKLRVALVGNPNCGKTTIFNALTGSTQRVGNWPGVTVEKKTGSFKFKDHDIEVVDLPGTYNLTMVSDEISIDEKIAVDYISSHQADLIINIIDASNLERNLYLSTQLLEMGVPVLIVLNMIDVAKERGMEIDESVLQAGLNTKVISICANKSKQIKSLQQIILTSATELKVKKFKLPSYPECINIAADSIQTAIQTQIPTLAADTNWLGLRLLEDDAFSKSKVNEDILKLVKSKQQIVVESLGDDADIFIADSRYSFANELVNKARKQGQSKKRNLTKIIDKVVLNRIAGIPIFFAVMYLMFLFAINIGGAFQDFFDIGSNTIFVQGLSHVLSLWHVPAWLTALIASGIGKGINTTITFAPIIGGMFLFLSFLEDSGYMARAAFVMDRFMRAMGLPGKSFVPLIVGFGCNVPAIMSARTLENKRDRIITVMMSPFMSCGARLAIFAVFTAAFFPKGGQNIVFALYIIGILTAVLTGLILRKTLLQGEPAPMIMELPPYHMPRLKVVVRHAWNRLKSFLIKAGRLIIPICILIGALNAFNLNGTLSFNNASSQSLLSYLGHLITPIFAPLGLKPDNWPATVGLLTGVLAKEVVIATLNTLYTQVGHLASASQHFDFWTGIHAALISIPDNLRNLASAFSNPILASAPDHSVSQGVFGLMYQRFDGQVGAFAYLLFVLLYIPCVSSAAVMARELGKAWTLFSLFWNTSLAYCVAVLFYQLATFNQHKDASLLWVLAILLFFSAIFMGLKYFAKSNSNTKVSTIPPEQLQVSP